MPKSPPLSGDTKEILADVARAIRVLAIDAIEAANSGHPGLPLGCAEIGAYLFSQGLTYNPKNPNWVNRDKFILSAGHGSMLLYACLFLAGYDISLDSIKQFRQLGRPTAGHPEYGHIPGVETTTGPLGQGIANAVGIALADKMTIASYKLEDKQLLSSHTVVLAGDGCLMEGISAEACSLAGHLRLDNLIVIYDSNDICLDGPTSECFTEDVAARYKAYGWNVDTIDGHDVDSIHASLEAAKKQTDRPTLIVAKTVIGAGAPNVQGTSEVHGKALGAQEARLTKQGIGASEELFNIPKTVSEFFEQKSQISQQLEAEWNIQFEEWKSENPNLAARWEASEDKVISKELLSELQSLELPDGATRQSSGKIIQLIAKHLPYVVGGSADLSCSDNTLIKSSGIVSAEDFSQKNIKYGVREFAMGAIASGMALQGTVVPYCGTFLTFSDYMKNSIRLAALMNVQVIYQFTHDSIFLGEDGPTHQPIEHLASLRSIPNVTVIRPADSTEVAGAWLVGLQSKGPVALVLSRQSLPNIKTSSIEGLKKGGYVVRHESGDSLDVCLIATGSEVSLALDTSAVLEERGKNVRVVSLPSFELFDQQPQTYREQVLGCNAALKVSIEAQSTFGWHKYVGADGLTIGIDTFGLSGKGDEVGKHFGFTKEAISKKILES